MRQTQTSDGAGFTTTDVLSMDVAIIFFTRGIRLYAYGGISVVLLLYLSEEGLKEADIGYLLTCIVLGDLVISLCLTSHADSTLGRRRTLIFGAILMCVAGVGFSLCGSYFPGLLVAGTLGVISGTGGEIGPFLPVEQAALCECIHGRAELGPLLGYYSAMGYFAQALGAFSSGIAVWLLQAWGGWAPSSAHRAILVLYAVLGGLKAVLYAFLSPAVEVDHRHHRNLPSPPSPHPPPPRTADRDGVLFAPPQQPSSSVSRTEWAQPWGCTPPPHGGLWESSHSSSSWTPLREGW